MPGAMEDATKPHTRVGADGKGDRTPQGAQVGHADHRHGTPRRRAEPENAEGDDAAGRTWLSRRRCEAHASVSRSSGDFLDIGLAAVNRRRTPLHSERIRTERWRIQPS